MDDRKIADLIFLSSIFLSAGPCARNNDQIRFSACSIISACSANSACSAFSEPQLEAELDDARAASGSSNLAKIASAQVSGGISEGRGVGHVVGLGPEFERNAFRQSG